MVLYPKQALSMSYPEISTSDQEMQPSQALTLYPPTTFFCLDFFTYFVCSLSPPCIRHRCQGSLRDERRGSTGPQLETTQGSRGGERRGRAGDQWLLLNILNLWLGFQVLPLSHPHQALPVPQACQASAETHSSSPLRRCAVIFFLPHVNFCICVFISPLRRPDKLPSRIKRN